MKSSRVLVLVIVAACSKSSEPSKSEAKSEAKSEGSAGPLAPKERLHETYEEIFQRGPMLPIEERTAKFLAKVAAPATVEAGNRTWFARDAGGECYEIVLRASGMLESSQITDRARADAQCAAPK